MGYRVFWMSVLRYVFWTCPKTRIHTKHDVRKRPNLDPFLDPFWTLFMPYIHITIPSPIDMLMGMEKGVPKMDPKNGPKIGHFGCLFLSTYFGHVQKHVHTKNVTCKNTILAQNTHFYGIT